MGVLTSHISSEFYMPASYKEAAFKSLLKFIRNLSNPTDYVYDVDGVLNATTLNEALYAAGLNTSETQHGDIIDLIWIADKLPGDVYSFTALLQSFVRFVRAGSYIELEEEFSTCRFTFKSKYVDRYYCRYDSYDGSLARARRALEKKQSDEAISNLMYATEVRPEYCMAWVELAKVYAELRLWDKATEACEKAEAAPSKIYNGISFTLDYSETGYAAYLHNADYLTGNQALLYREYFIAVSPLQRAAHTLPKESTIVWKLAEALYEVRNYVECFEAAQGVLTIEPEHTYGKYYSALSLHQLARPKEAMHYFAQISKQLRSWIYLLCIYAEAARDAGDYKRMNQLCERIQKRSDTNMKRKGESAWDHIAIAHALLILKRWEEAQKEAEIAQSSHPEHAYILNILGAALLMQDELEKAIPHFEKAIQTAPQWEFPKYNLAQCYLKRGRSEDAQKLLEGVFAINRRLEQRPDFA